MDKVNVNPISFELSQILQHQFSTFEIGGLDNKIISEEIGIGFGANEKNKQVGCNFSYQLQVEDKPFIKIEIGCIFKIDNAGWDSFRKESKALIPVGFARHLAVITSGTTRGVLFANTRDTMFNNFPMSLVNIEEIIKEDIELAEVKYKEEI